MNIIITASLFLSLIFAIGLSKKIIRLEEDNARLRARVKALRKRVDSMVERPF